MKIKKIGHCCLIIELKGKRIMTDPGVFSTAQDAEQDIDIILITHDHQDHLHIDSLKHVLINNPDARVITNSTVGKMLDQERIAYEILEHGQGTLIHNIVIEGFGEHHAEIYKEFGQTQNTGYFIDDKLFYPGDAFTNPKKPVDILALPVVAPWMKLSEAINYALSVRPRVAFPVHDAIVTVPQMLQTMCSTILPKSGIQFIPLNPGDEHEF